MLLAFIINSGCFETLEDVDEQDEIEDCSDPSLDSRMASICSCWKEFDNFFLKSGISFVFLLIVLICLNFPIIK